MQLRAYAFVNILLRHKLCIICRAKHPTKLHIWAGISEKGVTEICIFEGIMNAALYTDILENTLVPFVNDQFPDGHKFMQDNDPKHTSRQAQTFMEKKVINWWRTPADPQT